MTFLSPQVKVQPSISELGGKMFILGNLPIMKEIKIDIFFCTWLFLETMYLFEPNYSFLIAKVIMALFYSYVYKLHVIFLFLSE